jgi:YD repeat-containing protein
MTERRIPTINNTTYALTQWTYNTLGEVASESRYLVGQTATSTSGTAVTASYSYDTKTGWMTGKTDNAGRNVSYVYDKIGNVKWEKTLISTENYHTIYYEYDSMNRRTKKTEYLQTRDTTAGSSSTTSVSLETVYTYDLNGNLLTEKNPNNITTTYTYDAMNRQTSVSYPNYNESNSSVTVTTSQTYNNMGLVSTQTDERGKVTSLSYDKRGRLLSTTYPDGGIAAYAYDVGGRMIAQVSPENYESGKTADQMSYQTVYTYDAMDRVKTTGFKKTTTTTTLETLTYDNAGNVLTRKNAMNNTTSYAYDAASRLVTITHPSSLGTSTNAYDALGRVTQNTNEKGVVSQYTYDYADNLLTQSVATIAGAVTVLTNTYDKVGNVLTSTDANGSVTTNTYNEMGWLRTTTLPGDDSVPANTVTYC